MNVETTGTCAWVVWDAKYPAEGRCVVFARETEASARTLAWKRLGYSRRDIDDALAQGLAPADIVAVRRVPQLDRYACDGFVEAADIDAALMSEVVRMEDRDTAATAAKGVE